jgi:outer membrane protein assembly factor BamB
MKFSISLIRRKQTASCWTVGLMLAVAPLWLMLAAANTSARAQTSDNVVPSSTNASTTSSPADWTQFHRDNMQRWNPYETVLGVNNVGKLGLKWQFLISVSLPSVAVVNGVVYVGSNDGTYYALNARSGAKLWSFQTAGNFETSSPAVVNGVVYVGGGAGDNVYALNASSGAKLWSFTTGSEVYSSPAVVNGVVYIGSGDGNIYALNASTGAKLWSYATGSYIRSSPAVANGVVYVGAYDGNVYALNASSGAKLWSYSTGNQVQTSPAVANGVVYVGSADFNVYALNASTGAKLWSYATGSYVYSSPAVANGVVYIGSEDFNVYALNASTGAKLWSYDTGNKVESSPAVANGVVYVGTRPGGVDALNASTGALLWSYATGSVGDSSPAVVNGTLYIGSSAYSLPSLGSADLFLRIWPSTTTVHQGDLLTYAFPVWNLGPDNADLEVLNTQVPEGTTFDYIRISGTPGLGTCTHPPYQGTGQIICHENSSMAPNTTWTVRLTVKVTAPSGTVIAENAATLADTTDPNPANNTATVSIKVH